MTDEKFDNLDAWVPKVVLPNYEKDVLSKLLRKKKEEEKKEDKQGPLHDPFPIGGGVPGGRSNP